MKLSQEHLESFQEQGLLFIPECFSLPEVEVMRAALPALTIEETPARVLEKDNKTVRALHGCHATTEIFQRLTRNSRLLEPAQQILGSEVYLYQFKINLKAGFSGDVWPWHQDFVFWHKEDGMPLPRALNVAVFFDEFNEFNGPIYFIPRSHKENLFHLQLSTKATEGEKTEWVANVSADLKYTLDRGTINKLVDKAGLVGPKGPSGSVLFFHSNIVHGSASNISPYDRRVAIITYNSIENIPVFPGQPRPEFLVNQDRTPLKPLA